jgi:aminoglycoside phosphotransferase
MSSPALLLALAFGKENGAPVSIESSLLSLYPPETRILEIRSYRPGYADFPARASARLPDGTVVRCVVKRSGDLERLQTEAALTSMARELGLPAPEILAGPLPCAEEGAAGSALFMSEMPGRPLPWIALNDLREADRTCDLLFAGVRRLHGLTEAVRRHPAARLLPEFGLMREWEAIVQRSADWERDDRFARAVEILGRTLPRIEAPLVFSNGDYNPLNFLADENGLTGWIDFEYARFEDPHIGFAKFLLWADDDYGWGTGKKTGLVERWLYAENISRREFAPRLALRLLWHLTETPFEEEKSGPALSVLEEMLETV